MVRVVQGPGYRKMTIRPKDTAACGDSGTPNMATYDFWSAIMGLIVFWNIY